MALTRDFRETVQARAATDPAFRAALLQEALDSFLEDDLDTGKALLRDYINATVGFQTLGDAVDMNSKSLMRMFAPGGNPTARNLFAVISRLQEYEGVEFEVRVRA